MFSERTAGFGRSDGIVRLALLCFLALQARLKVNRLHPLGVKRPLSVENLQVVIFACLAHAPGGLLAEFQFLHYIAFHKSPLVRVVLASAALVLVAVLKLSPLLRLNP